MKDFTKLNLGMLYIAFCIVLWSLIPTVAKLEQPIEVYEQIYLIYLQKS